jgi:hypothetical protein
VRIGKNENRLFDLIDTFGAATTSQVQKLIYPEMEPKAARRYAQDRLKMLVENKHLKRYRSDLNSEYIYFMKKTPFIHHQVLLVNVYLAFLRMNGDLIEFTPEVVMGDIRPDAKVEYDDGENTHFVLVEIHRNNAFNQEKYEQFFVTKAWKQHFEAFPKILIVSDRRVKLQPSKVPFYIVRSDLKGIERVVT